MLDPKIWGRNMWTSLVHVAMGYPVAGGTSDQVRNYQVFFTSLGFVLPCEKCQLNYQKHIKEKPIDLSSRDALLGWLHWVYNQTLVESGQSMISKAQFLAKYQNPAQTGFALLNWWVVLIVLLLVGYFLGNRYGWWRGLTR